MEDHLVAGKDGIAHAELDLSEPPTRTRIAPSKDKKQSNGGQTTEWFDLSWFTAWIGQILWTMPYAFVVILITMSRYRIQQTEAARSCGATGWQAFWQVEFPQIRPGVFSSCAFVFILSFNEYTRTNMLNGGFDTFTTYVVNYMLSTGMDPEVYAMSSMISIVSIVVIVSVIAYLLSRPELRDSEERQPSKTAG